MSWDVRFFKPYTVRRLGEASLACSLCGALISRGEVYFLSGESVICVSCFGPSVLGCDLFFSDGDLEIVESFELDRQDVYSRALTDNPDWYWYPELGANLSELRGEPNTRETAARGVEQLVRALTQDGRWRRADVSVVAVPVSESKLVFYVSIPGAEAAFPIEVGS